MCMPLMDQEQVVVQRARHQPITTPRAHAIRTISESLHHMPGQCMCTVESQLLLQTHTPQGFGVTQLGCHYLQHAWFHHHGLWSCHERVWHLLVLLPAMQSMDMHGLACLCSRSLHATYAQIVSPILIACAQLHHELITITGGLGESTGMRI